jgi:uncharacterized protein YndB with AHSA1/START domain
MEQQAALAAIAEPTRLRIVELLAAAPRTVGELARLLDALQPQTTKHVQALEAAGVVTVHRLGRRRVVALRRETIRDLAGHFSALVVASPLDTVLEQYERAVRVEEERARRGEPRGRHVRLRRTVPADVTQVWSAWTDPEVMREWWGPEPLRVTDCTMEAVVGGPVAIVLAEPDGGEHRAAGEVRAVEPGRRLTFSLDPLGPDGSPAVSLTHDVRLASKASGTAIELVLIVDDHADGAESVLAGIEIGWSQTLDRLVALLTSR